MTILRTKTCYNISSGLEAGSCRSGEMVDAHASEACPFTGMEVQVLSSAQIKKSNELYHTDMKEIFTIPRNIREKICDDNEIFIYTPEQISAIKLEAQSLQPTEQRKMDDLVMRAHQLFIHQFPYLQDSFTDEEIKSKFIFVDRQSYLQWSNAHLPDAEEFITYTDDVGQMWANSKDGNFIVGMKEDDKWEYVPQDEKRRLISEVGSEAEARSLVSDRIHFETLLHEITHIYQLSPKIPLWLREAQAYWVEENILDKESRELIDSMSSGVDVIERTKIALFYQALLEKYGPELQYLCFSGFTYVKNMDIDIIVKDVLLSTIVEVFPEYTSG